MLHVYSLKNLLWLIILCYFVLNNRACLQDSLLTSAYKVQFEYTDTGVLPKHGKSEHNLDEVVMFHILPLLPTFFFCSN